MEVDFQRKLVEYVERKRAEARIDFDKLLFGPQRAFAQSTKKRKAAICSRRAGKTRGVATVLLKKAFDFPFSVNPYVTMSRPQAKENLWLPLQQIDDELELGLKFNHAELRAVAPSGGQVVLKGANDEGELNRLRGGKWPAICFDEIQLAPQYIEKIINEAVMPGLLDYDGTLLLTGTPHPRCHGFFYDVTTGRLPGWQVHHWTMFDNPHLVNRDEWVAEQKRNRGLTETHPVYRREFLGEWVKDDSSVVFPLKEANVLAELPQADWQYVIGIDLGFNDPTAFVVWAYSLQAAKAVVVDSWERTDMTPSTVAAHVDRMRDEYAPVRIVADSGGFGKGYVEEMNERWGLNVRPAKKADKFTYIAHMNGAFRAHSAAILRSNRQLIDDLSILTWNEGMSKYQDGCRDHLADAMLYGWRECRDFLFDHLKENPKEFSDEWWRQEEQKMFRQAQAQFNPKSGLEDLWDSEDLDIYV